MAAKSFAYRSDIDGLRAIAVSVVIAFHVGILHLSGGYVDRVLKQSVEAKWHFRYASLYDVLCQDGQCIEYADAERGIPLMDVNQHFNRYGAQLVIRRLVQCGELTE